MHRAGSDHALFSGVLQSHQEWKPSTSILYMHTYKRGVHTCMYCSSFGKVVPCFQSQGHPGFCHQQACLHEFACMFTHMSYSSRGKVLFPCLQPQGHPGFCHQQACLHEFACMFTHMSYSSRSKVVPCFQPQGHPGSPPATKRQTISVGAPSAAAPPSLPAASAAPLYSPAAPAVGGSNKATAPAPSRATSSSASPAQKGSPSPTASPAHPAVSGTSLTQRIHCLLKKKPQPGASAVAAADAQVCTGGEADARAHSKIPGPQHNSDGGQKG
uniref:Uncharacterized protein n=1 Tax=Dunaliella tertiolecta TaxID=3047 RepID=A0A7S3R771_DUNTE